MASSHNTKLNHLSPLTTHWHNRSMSDISATSDTATFHSAHAHLSNLELRPLSQPQLQHTKTPCTSTPQPISSPKLESIKMNRQDSGYSETPLPIKSSPSSRRTSIASSSTTTHTLSTTKGQTKRRSTTSRPSTKRSSRSSAQLRTSHPGSRPTFASRHTTPFPSTQTQQTQYQYFQFPTLPPSPPQSQPTTQPLPCVQPPPPTIQYWTSDSTRRLEYAAIDAASKGFRGLVMKMVPDCILPAGSKRQRFHECGDEGDGRSDCGSVRRYRLVLEGEEKGDCGVGEEEVRGSGKGRVGRGGLLRRWTGRS